MKNIKKLKCILLSVSFILIAFCFNGIEEVLADQPQYVYEGIIVDGSGNGIEGVEITVKNLETSQNVLRETDIDGIFIVDFTELEWNPQFEVKFETINAEEFYLIDVVFYIGVFEDITFYIGTTKLKNPLTGSKIFTIDCGKYHLTESSGAQDSDFEDSNETTVESDLQRRIQPTFDTYFDYSRTDTSSHFFTYYILTKEQTGLYPVKDSYNVNFTTPLADWSTLTTHNGGYYKWPGMIGQKQMVSENGINCYILLNNVWQPDGSGAGAHGYQADFK